MKSKSVWLLLLLIAIILVGGWSFSYVQGRVLATAAYGTLTCRIRERPMHTYFDYWLDKVLSGRPGEQVYICEILHHGVVLTSCSFEFGGSNDPARTASIDLDHLYADYILFHIDSNIRRCDFTFYKGAAWTTP